LAGSQQPLAGSGRTADQPQRNQRHQRFSGSRIATARGGYTTTNGFAGPPDPDANLTTLDAQEQGRVLYITGDISPTIEGLRITGGDADGLGGDSYGFDVGGGVYIIIIIIITATAAISNNQVYHNTADHGGGLYLYNSDAMLSGNTVTTNTADLSGGGLYLYDSDANLGGNTVSDNTAGYRGGGLCLKYSAATFSGNTVTANIADHGGMDCVGLLTNVVEVTTEEGAAGDESVTVSVGWYIYLPVVLRDY